MPGFPNLKTDPNYAPCLGDAAKPCSENGGVLGQFYCVKRVPRPCSVRLPCCVEPLLGTRSAADLETQFSSTLWMCSCSDFYYNWMYIYIYIYIYTCIYVYMYICIYVCVASHQKRALLFCDLHCSSGIMSLGVSRISPGRGPC